MASGRENRIEMQEATEAVAPFLRTIRLTGRLSKPLPNSLERDAPGCVDNHLSYIMMMLPSINRELAEEGSWTIRVQVVGAHGSGIIAGEDQKRADPAASDTFSVLIDGRVELVEPDVQEFVSLPTSHIFLGEGEIAKPWVQAWVKEHVCTLGLPWLDAVAHLRILLADLPSSTPLRHLSLILDAENMSLVSPVEMQSIVDAFKSASFPLEGVCFDGLFVDDLCFLESCNVATNYLGVFGRRYSRKALDIKRSDKCSGLPVFEAIATRNVAFEAFKVKELVLAGPSDGYRSVILQHPNCTLTRLDLRGCLTSRDSFQDFLGAMALNNTVTDLGFPMVNDDDLDLTAATFVGRPMVDDDDLMMGLFLNSRLHTRLHTLRLNFPTASACQLLLQGLADSSSTLQFLEISGGKVDFWPSLIPRSSRTTLRALRVCVSWILGPSFGEYLRCSGLVYLEIDLVLEPNYDEWEYANALVNNLSLCTLAVPWNNKAAEARAASLIRRNLVYRAGQLLKEVQVQPNTAKLFLCGHAEAGKTTLCQALHKAVQHPWLASSLSTMSCCFNSQPKRTRGMEFHPLAFQRSSKKLLICDLAGQEEFHVFHHYFMNANMNDLFVVVCKVDTSSSSQDFERQLDYWLRFIVSHRSARNKSKNGGDPNHSEIKPKVIVVVNFFEQQQTPDARRNITHDWSHSVMRKFSEVLDFGGFVEATGNSQYNNLFGLNARTGDGVHRLKLALDSLFREFIATAWPIPKLCYDISAKLIKGEDQSSSWFCPRALAIGQRGSRLLISYSTVLNMLSDGNQAGIDSARIKAALQELHNQGFVVFFPSEEMNDPAGECNNTSSTVVITNTSWFFNKLVGSLLGTHLEDEPSRSCKCEWRKEDIKAILRKQGCEETHLEEILRYLQRLQLCTSLDIEPRREKGLLLFPALIKEEKIQYPVVANAHEDVTFFGRRIRCIDSSIHLIPFGVFTRLQVKLHQDYCANNESFCVGYGWVSFMRGNVGVVVRFGGDVRRHEASESKQWIDILTFCADRRFKHIAMGNPVGGHHVMNPMGNPSFIAVNKLMDEIKKLIYDTCIGSEIGGILTVMLEECILQSKEPGSWTVALSSLLEKVRKEGLQESYQEWSVQIPVTPAINLLLPKEIEGCVKGWFKDLAIIEDEFSLNVQSNGTEGQELELGSSDGAGCSSSVQVEAGDGGNQKLQDPIDESGGTATSDKQSDQFQQLILSKLMSLKAEMKRSNVEVKSCITSGFRRQEKMLQIIREDIRELGGVLEEAKREIIVNCSTRLLVHELGKESAYPRYPFLVDVKGTLAPLKALVGKWAVVHFMCESPTEGPHPVEGQKGKDVTLEVKEWVAKLARVMVPAVRILCCLARVAASVYLPGAQALIPAAPDVLVSGLGIGKEMLQQVILPKALEALLAQLPDVDQLRRPGYAAIIEEEELKEVMEAILQNREVDMASDFGLHRVYFDHTAAQTFWVCDHHLPKGQGNGKRLRWGPLSNPYKE